MDYGYYPLSHVFCACDDVFFFFVQCHNFPLKFFFLDKFVLKT